MKSGLSQEWASLKLMFPSYDLAESFGVILTGGLTGTGGASLLFALFSSVRTGAVGTARRLHAT